MKTKYISLLLGVLFFISCEEELNIPPNADLIADTAFQTVADIETGLNSAYSSVYASYAGSGAIGVNSIFTDNTKVGAFSGGQRVNFHAFILNANSGEPATLWTSNYQVINRANRVIQAAGNIEIDAADQGRLDHALGQCYGLRAFAHFNLFSYFTEDYTNTGSTSVPVVLDVVTIDNRPRNTVAEVVAAIKADISTAKNLLDADEAAPQYITADALTGLEARLALFTNDFPGAKTAADNLISKYPLANQTQYDAMWLDQDFTEVIYSYNILADGAGIGFTWTFNDAVRPDPFLEVSNSLIGELFNGDVRNNAILNLDRFFQDGIAVVNKYPGAGALFVNDLKLMRVSEMYLIAAEAAARNNDVAAVSGYLETLLDTRFGEDIGPISFSNQNEALDFILTQRRVELAFEGHRYLDLKRFGAGINRDISDCGDLNSACTLDPSDHRMTMPIPVDELGANDLMVQNSGY